MPGTATRGEVQGRSSESGVFLVLVLVLMLVLVLVLVVAGAGDWTGEV